MRRRLLINEVETDVYVFSAETTYKTVSYNSGTTTINITSTLNDEFCSYSVSSYTTNAISTVTTSNTSITVKYKKNGTLQSKNDNIMLVQSDSNKQITVNIRQNAGVVSGSYPTVMSGTTSARGTHKFSGATGTISIQSKPDWVEAVTSLPAKVSSVILKPNSENTSSATRSGTVVYSIAENSKTISQDVYQTPKTYPTIDGHAYVTASNGKKVAVEIPSGYYMYGKGSRTYQQTSGETVYEGTENPLALSADSVNQLWGGGWRMLRYDDYVITDSFYAYIGSTGYQIICLKINNEVVFVIPHDIVDYYINGDFVDNGYIDEWFMTATPYGQGFYYYKLTGTFNREHFNNRRYGMRVFAVHD